MKAKIIITPKKAVLDPQGKSVQNEIELAGADKALASRQIDEACHKILSNPVIEDYRFEIE